MTTALVRDTTIDSNGEIRLEGLPLPAGETVRVVILPQTPVPTKSEVPFKDVPVHYDNPFDLACDPEEWEATR